MIPLIGVRKDIWPFRLFALVTTVRIIGEGYTSHPRFTGTVAIKPVCGVCVCVCGWVHTRGLIIE